MLQNPWEEEGGICLSCQKEIQRGKGVIPIQEPVCKKCGKPMSDERKEYCDRCMSRPHLFRQGKALWIYKGKGKKSIYRFKYGGRREYGNYYARELVKQYGGWVKSRHIDAIIPIPLHPSRQRQRGYNQAALITMEMGKHLGIPVESNTLLRTINTKPQKKLNDKERQSNLKKAFRYTRKKQPPKRVLLVDDIYTTGSTFDGAATALLEAGAEEVFFLTVSIGSGY
jgi:ComF family protein